MAQNVRGVNNRFPDFPEITNRERLEGKIKVHQFTSDEICTLAEELLQKNKKAEPRHIKPFLRNKNFIIEEMDQVYTTIGEILSKQNKGTSRPEKKFNQNYITELLRSCLIKDGVKNAVLLNTWEEKVGKIPNDELLSEVRSFSATIDVSPLENYIEATKIKTLESGVSVKYEVGSEIKTAFLPPLQELHDQGKTFVSIATDLNLSYEQIKNALRTILPIHFNQNTNAFPSELLLPFIISKEQCLSGQVISNLDGAKKSVTLITVYTLGGKFIYQYFGETKPTECKKLAAFVRYNSLFYVYKFQSDTTEEIILLSPEELDLSGCKIYGMEANCYDYMKIGNMARINTTQKVFFVHSQKPSVDTIGKEKFWEIAKDYNKEHLHKCLFGMYPHPDWFSRFMISWAFSGKLSEMPTHLSLMSPPALGKTKMLETMGTAFKQPLNDGGTIKGLVPSFANGIPKEGYLIKCRRFGFVDEFIHIIQSSSRNGSDFDGGSYQLLKVLEHSEGEHSSAFGIIKAKPKMWTCFCSNIRPYEHIKNLVDLHEKLNVAFMSRILWYVYNEEHIKFINDHKSSVMKFKKEESFPKHDPHFVSMVDYMHTFTIDIPIKVAQDIQDKYRGVVPASLELDIYDSRMIMHIYRMIDGYAKYKSVVENRGKFICTDDDVKECDEILGRIIKSWSENLNENQMSPSMRISYLGTIQREIFEFVKTTQASTVGGGVDEVMLANLKGITAVDIADELVKKKIFKTAIAIGPGACKIYFTHDFSI